MDNVSRTVRFKREEVDLIERFLEVNPFFDFSSLTRVALTQFIQDPKLPLKAIPMPKGFASPTSSRPEVPYGN